MLSFLQRNSIAVLWVAVFLSLTGGFYTIKLYQNLKTDLIELLPVHARSVEDLHKVGQRLVSIDNLAVLIFSENVHASRKFVCDLANKLKEFPKSEITEVEYKIQNELNFFKKRMALFMELSDLVAVKNYIIQRIEYEKILYNPLTIFAEKIIFEPLLDNEALMKKYDKKTKQFAHFPQGFFATADEKKRALLIDVPGKALGITGVKNLKDKVKQVIAQLKPSHYAADLEIHYTGSVQEMIEEQEALVEDLEISTIAVIGLVSLAMLIFFRSFVLTTALVVSLLLSTLWTFGFSYFIIGYLNANSAFLGSIVLGNGINFGIIFLARYVEERRNGRSHLRGNKIALRSTYKATLIAALAAGLSYGSLMLTSFRGFRQFGIIGLIGMCFSWISAYTLLPALLSCIERFVPLQKKWLQKKRRSFIINQIASLVFHYPKIITIISIIFTTVCLISTSKITNAILETNLENLRSKKSALTGAAFYSKSLNEIFQRFLTPLVILPESLKSTTVIAQKLKELQEKQGPNSSIISVQTIDDFIPSQQVEKIKTLKSIQALFTPKVLKHLSKKELLEIQALLTPESLKPFGIKQLPHLLKEKFREHDGSLGKLILVEPPLSHSIWEKNNLQEFINSLREVTDRVENNVPLVGGMPIVSDLVISIARDGPKATLLALTSVVGLVILLFRNLKKILLALLALFIGMTWFAGLTVYLQHWGLKINFLNFVALPITFGIGIDYGVNIFQRYFEQKNPSIVRTLQETGGAVGLASLTTMIGYSSLLMASNQGFVSFGLLAILGEITCVLAALLTLPAALVSRNPSNHSH